MTWLPQWVIDTPGALTLVNRIVAARPDPVWLRERDMFPRSFPRYATKDAGALRKLWSQLRDEALAAGDVSNDYAAFRDLNSNEPDELLHRLLQESEGLTVCQSDPLRHVEGEAA